MSKYGASINEYFSNDDLYNLCYASVTTYQPKSKYANSLIIPHFSRSFLKPFIDDVCDDIEVTNELIYFLAHFMFETKTELSINDDESMKQFSDWMKKRKDVNLNDLKDVNAEELNNINFFDMYYKDMITDDVIAESKWLLQRIQEELSENSHTDDIKRKNNVTDSIEIITTNELTDGKLVINKEEYLIKKDDKGRSSIASNAYIFDRNGGNAAVMPMEWGDKDLTDEQVNNPLKTITNSIMKDSLIVNAHRHLQLDDGKKKQNFNKNNITTSKQIKHDFKYLCYKRKQCKKNVLSSNNMSSVVNQGLIGGDNLNAQNNDSSNMSLVTENYFKGISNISIKPGDEIVVERPTVENENYRQTMKITIKKSDINADNNAITDIQNTNNNAITNIQRPICEQPRKKISNELIKKSITILFYLIEFMFAKNNEYFKPIYDEKYFREWLKSKENYTMGYTNKIKENFNLMNIDDFFLNWASPKIINLSDEVFREIIDNTLQKILKKYLKKIFSGKTIRFTNKLGNKSRCVLIDSLPEIIVNMIKNRKYIVRDLDCIPWEYVEQIIIDEILHASHHEWGKTKFVFLSIKKIQEVFYSCFKENIINYEISDDIIVNNKIDEVTITNNDKKKLIEKIILNDEEPNNILNVSANEESLVATINIFNLKKKIWEEIFGSQKNSSFVQILEFYQKSNDFQKQLYIHFTQDSDEDLMNDYRAMLEKLAKDKKLNEKYNFIANKIILCRIDKWDLIDPIQSIADQNKSINDFIYRRINKIFSEFYDGQKLKNNCYYDNCIAIYIDPKRRWINYIIDVKSLKKEIIKSFANLNQNFDEAELYWICKHAISHRINTTNEKLELLDAWKYFDYTMYYCNQLSGDNVNLLKDNQKEFGVEIKTVMNKNIWNFYSDMNKIVMETLFTNKKCVPRKKIGDTVFYQLNINEIKRILLKKFADKNDDIICLFIKQHNIDTLNRIIQSVFKKRGTKFVDVKFDADPYFITSDTTFNMNFSPLTLRHRMNLRTSSMSNKGNLSGVFIIKQNDRLDDKQKEELLTEYSKVVDEIRYHLIKNYHRKYYNRDYQDEYYDEILSLYAKALDIRFQYYTSKNLVYVGAKGKPYSNKDVFVSEPHTTFKFFNLIDYSKFVVYFYNNIDNLK